MGAEPETDTRPVVVYVEDDSDTFKIAALRLKTRYRLVWAQSDEEAVDLLAHHQKELYAVLMDIELRGSKLDGLELTRLLRGHSLTREVPPFVRRMPVLKTVPIVILTAYTSRYSEGDALALGATHFVTKPIDFTRLNLALAKANIAAVMKRLEVKEPPPSVPR